MHDLVRQFTQLSPAKRQLLIKIIQTQGSTFNTFPLSFAQQRLWFLDRLQPGSSTYTLTGQIVIEGALDAQALGQSFQELIQRHSILRTIFIDLEGQPFQVVRPTMPLPMPLIDLRDDAPGQQATRIAQLSHEVAQTHFDLAYGPLLRVVLVRRADREHVLLVAMHHIIADGQSLQIVLDEVAALYSAIVAGGVAELEPLPLQYSDFALWQSTTLHSPRHKQLLEYWQRQLSNSPQLHLRPDHPRPASPTMQGARISISIPAPARAALYRLSQQSNATLYMTLLAAFMVLLQRYTQQADLVVGTPIAERSQPGLAGLIGMFVNTLAIRADLRHDPSFRTVLGRVRQTCLEAYAHHDLPFEQIVQAVHSPQAQHRSSLFQIMFAFQAAALTPRAAADIVLSPAMGESGTAKFDLTLELEDRGTTIDGWFEYSTDLFEPATIARMREHFQQLLAQIVAQPDLPISRLALLTAAERDQIVRAWNATARPYPEDRCFHQLFEAQAARTPDSLAVIAPDGRLTYAELNARANQLARGLRRLGVGPEVLVGLFMERTATLLVALLAILKAGGAYLPLDVSSPPARLERVLADARVPLVLIQRTLRPQLGGTRARIIAVDDEWSMVAAAPRANWDSGALPDQLVYVIYTSGSTGRPKGVAQTHASLVNYLAWAIETYPFDAGETIPVHSSIAFDLTVTAMLAPLLAGRIVELLPEEQVLARLGATLQADAAVALIKLTPAHLEILAEQLRDAHAQPPHALVIGGETLRAEQIALWQTTAPATVLFNEYGPTETMVGCCVYQIPPVVQQAGPLPVGRPIANTALYILDPQFEPTPVGVAGELYIGGHGLARGYLHQPALTADKFLPCPFDGQPGSRMYRTGDLAYYLPGGDIVCLGRIDDQVKLRGFRIELREIEAVLAQHEAIHEVAVIVREDQPGLKQLVAYLVPASGQPLPVETIDRLLRAQLPEYMVPAVYVALPALPLTVNGKVDRQNLPQPQPADRHAPTAVVPPQTPTEIALAQIWQEMLGLERVSVTAHFFALGGHSLLATRVVYRVRELFQIDLPLHVLFEEPTIAQLATRIDRQRAQATGASAPGIAARRRGNKDLRQLLAHERGPSPSQRRSGAGDAAEEPR